MDNQTDKEPKLQGSLVVEKAVKLRSPEDRDVIVPEVDVPFNFLITSAHNVKSRLITDQLLSERQVVVAAGENSRFKVGDWVKINVETFPKSSKPGGHDIGNVIQVHPPFDDINGTRYMFMSDRAIKYGLRKKD